MSSFLVELNMSFSTKSLWFRYNIDRIILSDLDIIERNILTDLDIIDIIDRIILSDLDIIDIIDRIILSDSL